MRQVILEGEFKECVPQDLRTHLEGKNVKTLEEAALIFDTYTLSHKKLTNSQTSINSKTSDTYKKSGLRSWSSTNTQSPSQGGFKSGLGRFEGSLVIGSLHTCSYCKRTGFLISECFNLKRKNELDKIQPPACAAVRGYRDALVSICSDTLDVQGSKTICVDSIEDYITFFLRTFSLADSSKIKPVQILRDTGAGQTL